MVSILREQLKQELDQLNEAQLQQVAILLTSLRELGNPQKTPFWQQATPAERAAYCRKWVKTLPRTAPSLPDESLDRGNIYE